MVDATNDYMFSLDWEPPLQFNVRNKTQICSLPCKQWLSQGPQWYQKSLLVSIHQLNGHLDSIGACNCRQLNVYYTQQVLQKTY